MNKNRLVVLNMSKNRRIRPRQSKRNKMILYQAPRSQSFSLPKIGSPPRMRFCVRYGFNFSGNSIYTSQITSDVMASLLCLATVNGTGSPTTFIPYMDAVKLLRIRMFVQDATSTTGNTVTVTGSFPSTPVSSLTFGSKLVQSSDSILGSAGCAHIDMRPDPKSPQGNIIAGQSSSNIWFAWAVNTANAVSSICITMDIFFEGQPPTGYAISSTPVDFSFNASPISTVKGQLYAIPPCASLTSLASNTGGYPVNYSPLI